MEEIIIYVAGDPNAYPVEYYDFRTETFQGMIPKLLEEFSAQTSYDIRYFSEGKKDVREQLADNLQVDMVYGKGKSGEEKYGSTEEVFLFEMMEEGEPVSFKLFVLETAPETLAEDLRGFVSGTTEASRTGQLVEAANKQSVHVNKNLFSSVLGLIFLVLALGCGMAFMVCRYRKYLRAAKEKGETDSLTGIGNIEYFMHNYKTMVHDRNRILYGMFYFYIDMEYMYRVEGNEKITEFLRHTAAVLVNAASDTSILARISDGGFVVLRLSPGVREAKEWLDVTLKAIRDFSDFSLEGSLSHITAGIYKLKPEDHELEQVILQVSQGAQAACREGEDYKICTEEWILALMEEQGLQGEVEAGLEREEFHLYLQFYVDSGARQIIGGQALSRWEHPAKGFLSPGRFVPLMEKEGLISRLDYYLLNKICAFLEQIEQLGIERFFVSCNFSGETFEKEDFPERCKKILETYQFSREQLIFEIARSVKLKHTDMMIQNIKAVKRMGVQMAMEAFGENLPLFLEQKENLFDVLLLDRYLLDRLETERGRAVAEGMIQTGRSLGMTVCAKGVETNEQAKILEEMGCQILQGFHFHYPAPEWEIKRVLITLHDNQERGEI